MISFIGAASTISIESYQLLVICYYPYRQNCTLWSQKRSIWR